MMTLRRFFLMVCALWFSAMHLQAAVGFVNVPFLPGATYFGNPIQDTSDNLNALIASAPEGTSVALWNPVTSTYDPIATFTGGSWSTDLLLPVGTGACLLTDTTFTNTFVGTVLDYDGGVWGGGATTPAPPFGGPDGLYLWNSKFPAGGDHGGLLWDNIVGRAPNEGEGFWWFDTGTQTFMKTTYTSGAWDNGSPSLAVAEAVFFDIGGTGATPFIVPEPGTAALLGLGLLVSCRARRKRNLGCDLRV